MALDGQGDFFEGLSSGKKGTSSYIARIQEELSNSRIGNLSEYQEFKRLTASFMEWKMKVGSEVDVLLGLLSKVDKEAVFFTGFLSKEIMDDLMNFQKRLIEIKSQ